MAKTTDWKRLREIVEGALERGGEDRARYLDEACGADDALRREAELLLAEDAKGDDFLEPPDRSQVHDLLGEHFTSSLVGARVGPYAVRRVIGRGGMGTVYEARSEDPDRTVALKVMKIDLVDPKAERRFRNEAEILGKLEHPGIARVYDVGTARSGGRVSVVAPWFSMEYIEGAVSLLDHCRRGGLSEEERLGLFLEVCDALRHGHEQGFIHCDIKPGNLLVGRDGRPRIIDFGIGRAADFEGMSSSLKSAVGQLLGTVQYMSPEQLSPDPSLVDHRTDIYALGVVLYELVCDGPPYDLEGKSVTESFRTVIEMPPIDPTERVPAMHADLAEVVLRTLAKDQGQRYGSVAELADDLERYLAGEPIVRERTGLWSRLRRRLGRRGQR